MKLAVKNYEIIESACAVDYSVLNIVPINICFKGCKKFLT